MTTSEIAAVWSAIGQVSAAVLAIVAVTVSAWITRSDRRRADRQAEEDRKHAREAEERRWERDLLIRLAVSIEGKATSEEGRAAVLAIGPDRLPAACFLLCGDAVEQAAALNGTVDGLDDWDKARVEVARAIRHGLPAQTAG